MARIYKNKKILAVLTVAAVLAVGGALFVKSGQDKQAAQEKTAQQNHARNDSASGGQPGSSGGSGYAGKPAGKPPAGGAANQPPATTAGSSVPAPVLIKSSGNNGPVPAGANIEFVCQGPAGFACTVTLSDKNNPNRIIDLGVKKISDNQGETTGVNWYWEAVQGSWTVKAILSDSAGQSNSSAGQNLEVQ